MEVSELGCCWFCWQVSDLGFGFGRLVLVVGFVFGFSGSTLRPLDFASTRIDYSYLWFRIWLLLLGFFHLSLFVLGICEDGGKRIGLLLVLLKMDWWVCVCVLAGFVFVFFMDLSTFVFVFLHNLVFVF